MHNEFFTVHNIQTKGSALSDSIALLSSVLATTVHFSERKITSWKWNKTTDVLFQSLHTANINCRIKFWKKRGKPWPPPPPPLPPVFRSFTTRYMLVCIASDDAHPSWNVEQNTSTPLIIKGKNAYTYGTSPSISPCINPLLSLYFRAENTARKNVNFNFRPAKVEGAQGWCSSSSAYWRPLFLSRVPYV